MLVAEKQTNAG